MASAGSHPSDSHDILTGRTQRAERYAPSTIHTLRPSPQSAPRIPPATLVPLALVVRHNGDEPGALLLLLDALLLLLLLLLLADEGAPGAGEGAREGGEAPREPQGRPGMRVLPAVRAAPLQRRFIVHDGSELAWVRWGREGRRAVWVR